MPKVKAFEKSARTKTCYTPSKKRVSKLMRAKVIMIVLLMLALGGALYFFQAPPSETEKTPDSQGVTTTEAPIPTAPDSVVTNEKVSPNPVSTPADPVEPAPEGRYLALRVVNKGTKEGLPGATVRASTSERPTPS